MAVAKIEAFLIRRDTEGKIIPFEVEVMGIREHALTIEILPTTIGSLKGLSDPDGDAIKWPVEDKLRYLREHVVKPDFSALTSEELEERMTMWDLDMLLITAIQHGGPMRQRKEKKGKGPTVRGGRSGKKSPRSKRTSIN